MAVVFLLDTDISNRSWSEGLCYLGYYYVHCKFLCWILIFCLNLFYDQNILQVINVGRLSFEILPTMTDVTWNEVVLLFKQKMLGVLHRVVVSLLKQVTGTFNNVSGFSLKHSWNFFFYCYTNSTEVIVAKYCARHVLNACSDRMARNDITAKRISIEFIYNGKSLLKWPPAHCRRWNTYRLNIWKLKVRNSNILQNSLCWTVQSEVKRHGLQNSSLYCRSFRSVFAVEQCACWLFD